MGLCLRLTFKYHKWSHLYIFLYLCLKTHIIKWNVQWVHCTGTHKWTNQQKCCVSLDQKLKPNRKTDDGVVSSIRPDLWSAKLSIKTNADQIGQHIVANFYSPGADPFAARLIYLCSRQTLIKWRDGSRICAALPAWSLKTVPALRCCGLENARDELIISRVFSAGWLGHAHIYTCESGCRAQRPPLCRITVYESFWQRQAYKTLGQFNTVSRPP